MEIGKSEVILLQVPASQVQWGFKNLKQLIRVTKSGLSNFSQFLWDVYRASLKMQISTGLNKM